MWRRVTAPHAAAAAAARRLRTAQRHKTLAVSAELGSFALSGGRGGGPLYQIPCTMTFKASVYWAASNLNKNSGGYLLHRAAINTGA